MTRIIGILIISFFVFYVIKILFRMMLNNFAKKINPNQQHSTPPKPKSNLDKSKAIDAKFEELN